MEEIVSAAAVVVGVGFVGHGWLDDGGVYDVYVCGFVVV